MDAKQLEELRKQSVKNITTALPKLSRDELASLLAHEPSRAAASAAVTGARARGGRRRGRDAGESASMQEA